MTAREKIMIEKPNAVGDEYHGGVAGCPCGYGYLENPEYCKDESISLDVRCTNCWDRELPETATREKLTREKILETAVKMVCGHREQDYGKPENNFQCIADLWTAYLYHNTKPDFGVSVSAADVAALMILFKVGRLATGAGSADTWVDIAGYAACGGEIATNGGAV